MEAPIWHCTHQQVAVPQAVTSCAVGSYPTVSPLPRLPAAVCFLLPYGRPLRKAALLFAGWLACGCPDFPRRFPAAMTRMPPSPKAGDQKGQVKILSPSLPTDQIQAVIKKTGKRGCIIPTYPIISLCCPNPMKSMGDPKQRKTFQGLVWLRGEVEQGGGLAYGALGNRAKQGSKRRAP